MIYIYIYIVLVVLNDVRMPVYLNILVTTPVYFSKYIKVGRFLFLWWVFILKVLFILDYF
jgi:hypothetical protein